MPVNHLMIVLICYMCVGGNTFHLLHSIQSSSVSIQDQVLAMCNRGGLYIGSSAGAVLVSPSIASAGEVHPDRNVDGVVDLTGFHFYSSACYSALHVFTG